MVKDETKIKKPALTLKDLPDTLLSCTGSFLKIQECFRAARCCKENQGLQAILDSVSETVVSSKRDDSLLRAEVSSLAMCPNIRSLEVSGTVCRLSFLEPLLNRSIGSSLLSLKVILHRPCDMEDLPLILALLPSCTELHLFVCSCFSYENSGSTHPLKKLMQPAHWPRTLQVLELEVIQGGETVRHVAEAISSGAFSLLRELYLNDMVLDRVEDAACLGRALMKSGGKLETLHLLLLCESCPNLDFISHMLGLHMEDPMNESFNSLKLLKIGGASMDWILLGTAILRGRFPQLTKIRRECPCMQFWFEVSAPCTRLWFEVIRNRNLQAFDDYRFRPDDLLPLSKEFLSGLALAPLQPDLTSCIGILSVSAPLDDEACNALARAIGLRNLTTMSCLELSFNISCDSTNVEGLGRVIHPGFIPGLKYLTLLVDNEEEDGPACLRCWRSFFEAMPVEGRSLFSNLQIGTSDSRPKGISMILQALGSPANSIILSKVTCLELRGDIHVDDLTAISAAFMAGVFPSLIKLRFEGSVYPVLLSNVARMRVFLNTLSHHTHIEDLDFGCYPSDDSPYRTALEPFLSFFFRSPKLFTSLNYLDFGSYSDNEEEEWEEDLEEDEEEPEPLMAKLLEQAIEDKKSCFAAKTIRFQDEVMFPLD